jgi:hypothetical protein
MAQISMLNQATAQLQEFISDDQENPAIHSIAGFASQTSPTQTYLVTLLGTLRGIS